MSLGAFLCELGQNAREALRGEIADVDHVLIDLRFERRIGFQSVQHLQRALHL
jgi:hypothetical protein